MNLRALLFCALWLVCSRSRAVDQPNVLVILAGSGWALRQVHKCAQL